MNELLSGLKADLSSRRMLPLLGLAAAALIGALAYVALAGKSGASTASSVAATPPVSAPPLEGPSVSAAPANPNAAVAETTAGASDQHGGKMRNPFLPLPSRETSGGGASASSTSGSSTSGGSSSGGSAGNAGGSSGASESGGSGSAGGGPGGGSGSSGSGGSGSGSGSAGPSSSGSGGASPDNPVIAYHVDVRLQQLSEAGQPIGQAQVFKDIVGMQPLPSKHKALIAAVAVTGKGAGVAFVLLKEAIMHGGGRCLPSAEDCAAIDLKPHASEELQYLQSDGTVTYYKLTLTKLEKIGAGASAASAGPAQGSAAGHALIARLHLTIPSAADFGGSRGTIVGASHG